MVIGVRIEISVRAPQMCYILNKTQDSGISISSVSRSAAGDTLIEDVITTENIPIADDGNPEIITFDNKHIYRFSRDRTEDCPCNRVERHGCPVNDVNIRDNEVWILFYAKSLEMARAVIKDLNDTYPSVTVRRITQSSNESESDFVFIDRSIFTDRQIEVLRAAYEKGYFAHPREANAHDVAEALEISTSTFIEHLARAQQKLTKEFFLE